MLLKLRWLICAKAGFPVIQLQEKAPNYAAKCKRRQHKIDIKRRKCDFVLAYLLGHLFIMTPIYIKKKKKK